jgi:hypothetical protein
MERFCAMAARQPLARLGKRMTAEQTADALPSSPMPSPDLPAAPHACANCGQLLAAPPPPFCPHCGQETRVRPPRLGEFMQQFGGAYLSTEGALWRSLWLLLARPGELTRQYLSGRRKHYVLPLRLYLTVSVLVMLAMRLSASPGLLDSDGSGVEAVKIQRPANGEFVVLDFGPNKVGRRDGKFFCEGLPAALCQRFKRRLDHDDEGLKDEMRRFGERFLSNIGAAMFVMLPLFALWLKLVYLGRDLRYTEHLVFALHLHAFWFLALALTLPGLPWLKAVAVFAVPVYAMLALKRVYGGSLWGRLLRAAVVSLLYGVTLAFTLLALALWTLLA